MYVREDNIQSLCMVSTVLSTFNLEIGKKVSQVTKLPRDCCTRSQQSSKDFCRSKNIVAYELGKLVR